MPPQTEFQKYIRLTKDGNALQSPYILTYYRQNMTLLSNYKILLHVEFNGSSPKEDTDCKSSILTDH